MQSGGKEGITKFDFFRYTPVRLREQTVLGALLSLAVLLIAGSFVYNQIDRSFGDGVKTELLFENLHITDIEVHIDVDLLNLPCELVDLRFTSKRGAAHSLQRSILRNPHEPPSMHRVDPFYGDRDIETLLKAVERKEGCKISGEFHLHFISNNFFIGFGNQLLMHALSQKNPNFQPDLSHHINALTFGPNSSIQALEQKFDLSGFNTLGNSRQVEDRSDGFGGGFYHSYFLIAVPNIFDRMF